MYRQRQITRLVNTFTARYFAFLSPLLDRLWVRLSVAFTAIALLSVGSIMLVMALLLFNSGDGELRIIDELQRPGGTVDKLTQYYAANDSWRGVDVLLDGVQSAYPITPQSSVSFRLTATNGTLLYNSHPTRRDPQTIIVYNDLIPLLDEGRPVAYLNIMHIRLPGAGDWQRRFLNWLDDWWWLMALAGAGVGVAAGVLMSRTLTAPLDRFAQAAQAIGARDLNSRVPETGTAELMEMAHAFNQMAADLQAAERLRRNMVADVAHELRTPLTVLQGNLRAIIDGVYPLETGEISGLYDQTLVLARLVNDLHELSQAEARQLPLNMQQIDIGQMLYRLVATFEAAAEEQNIHVEMDIPADLPFVRGDQTRLAQVLNNLLDNAMIHTPGAGTVRITVWQAHKALCVAVSDTGRGITDEHLPYVFERFYRADRARSRNTGGSGLGLAIAKAIVEAHDGTIGVYSPGPDGGTTFTLRLPTYDMIYTPEPIPLP